MGKLELKHSFLDDMTMIFIKITNKDCILIEYHKRIMESGYIFMSYVPEKAVFSSVSSSH